MKQTTPNYAELRDRTGSFYEVRVERFVQNGANVIYGMDKLKSIRISQALFQDTGPQVGGVCSAKCKMKFIEQSANWPRMAAFEVKVRVRTSWDDSAETTGWVSYGTFYTDTRKERNGNLEIVAYDNMMRMEQSWTDKITPPASWPITARHAANLLENSSIGISFVNKSDLDDDSDYAYIGLNTASTVRDVLKSIAVGCGGNWLVQSNGQFRFIKLSANYSTATTAIAGYAIAGIAIVGTTAQPSGNTPSAETIQVGMAVDSIEKNTKFAKIKGVVIEDTVGNYATAGDVTGETGYVLKTSCLYANNSIASLCLTNVLDYEYRPFEASLARLDPIAEPGDFVAIANEMFPIITLDWNINAHPTADITAPFEEEVDHEFTTISPEAKNYKKFISEVDEVRSSITQTADSIISTVSRTYVTKADYNNKISEIETQLDGAIETWSGDVAPTLNNLPASGWSSSQKAKHVGDVYFVNTTSEAEEAGLSYRFEYTNGTYAWNLISDSVASSALAKAYEALRATEAQQIDIDDIAGAVEKKGRIFTVTPTTPYYVGDLWFTTAGELMKCVNEKLTGNFTSSDWTLFDTYTRDSDFESYKTTVNSTFSQQSDAINAKVSTTSPVQQQSFSWSLTNESHKWYSNNSEVMSVDANGLEVTGVIKATSGYIGSENNGFAIDSNSIHKGMSSLNDEENNGVYIGTNGIALGGGKFKVTSAGAITAKNLNIEGGSIFISNAQAEGQPYFHVDSNGNLYANSGTFGGTVFANQISGAVTQEQLAETVQNLLVSYQRAIAGTQSFDAYPEYLTVGSLYLTPTGDVQVPQILNEGTYAIRVNNVWYNLDRHTHSFHIGNDGKLYIEGADWTGTDHPFDLAATKYFQDAVAAASGLDIGSIKANYISYHPSTAAQYGNGEIASINGYQVYQHSDHKYVQAKFDLTAGNKESGSEETRFDFSSNDCVFNVDVTEVYNAGVAAGGGSRTITALSFVAGTDYSEVNASFSSGANQNNISLPTIRNTDLDEDQTIYEYGQYEGYGRGYDTGRSSVDSILGSGYETEDSYTDYTKLWVKLENNKIIGNIDVSSAYNAGTRNISSLTIPSASNYSIEYIRDYSNSQISAQNQHDCTANATLVVNGTNIGSKSIDITGITKKLYLLGFEPTVKSFNNRNNYLYLSTNYELRFQKGDSIDTDNDPVIIDYYDRSTDNYVDISGYISGGGSTSISSVAPAYYDETEEYEYTANNLQNLVQYNSEEDKIYGCVTISLSNGTSETALIKMSAAGKSGGGGSVTSVYGYDYDASIANNLLSAFQANLFGSGKVQYQPSNKTVKGLVKINGNNIGSSQIFALVTTDCSISSPSGTAIDDVTIDVGTGKVTLPVNIGYKIHGVSDSFDCDVDVTGYWQGGSSPAYSITQGNVEKNGKYDNNHWQSVTATFYVDGRHKSFSSGFSVHDAWQDGYNTASGGGSVTITHSASLYVRYVGIHRISGVNFYQHAVTPYSKVNGTYEVAGNTFYVDLTYQATDGFYGEQSETITL